MTRDERPTVYSTEQGDLRKQLPRKPTVKSLPPQQQTALVIRETKGRGGKIVSVVKNLTLAEEDLKELLKKLKQSCGTGGTIKDGMIEIQGDHRSKIAEMLRALGFKAKVAGG